MDKKEVQQRVLKDGQPLPLKLFTWDEKTKVFTSTEENLVIGFKGINDCTFNTGSSCTFKTGSNCTFKTGDDCVVVRRDVYEVIELKKGQKIKLNHFGVKGFTFVKE